jgi:hypothetical protein
MDTTNNGGNGQSLDTTTCPQCGDIAEVTERAVLESSHGPVEHARVVCVHRHWFLLPTASLTSPAGSGAAGLETGVVIRRSAS